MVELGNATFPMVELENATFPMVELEECYGCVRECYIVLHFLVVLGN